MARMGLLLVALFQALAAAQGTAAPPETDAVQAAPAEGPEVRVDTPTAPPPPKAETPSAQPSPTHAWIAGHWVWEKTAYAWVPGFWAPPPAPGYVWVAARWVQRGGVWYFRDGHWKPAAGTSAVTAPSAGVSVTVQQAPPAAIAEVRPAPPYAGAVWIPGFWFWNGTQYVWVAGSWAAPRPGFAWVKAHWKATPYGWRWVPGHWRRI